MLERDSGYTVGTVVEEHKINVHVLHQLKELRHMIYNCVTNTKIMFS